MPDKTPTSNAIEVRNLDFYYGKFKGLKNVNLNIAEHRVTAFIGPSGCGKSTLLRTLNRMYSLYPGQRAEGQINFYGQNILDKGQDLNLLRAQIGMVFQKPTPFPMSIYDNIAFGVRLYENLSRSDMDERVESALTKAAIWNEYTVAIVTHNMQQAARVSDFTAYMYLGELVEFGQTEQIFMKPAKQETEDYITGRFG